MQCISEDSTPLVDIELLGYLGGVDRRISGLSFRQSVQGSEPSSRLSRWHEMIVVASRLPWAQPMHSHCIFQLTGLKPESSNNTKR
jgi:hypothetical protein